VDWATRIPGSKISAAFLTTFIIIGWLVYFLPVKGGTALAGDHERYQRVIIWIILICAQLLAALIIAWRKYWLPQLNLMVKGERQLHLAAGLTLGIFLFLWAGIAATRIGITPDDRYWNEAGVPVLGFQMLLAWTLSMCFATVGLMAEKTRAAVKVARFFSTWGLDLLVCLTLWIAAGTIWSQSPMDRSYFAPGPYPPHYVYYPYSDAEAHDLGAQYVLIGQGLNNNQYHDKPFYMLFLTALHMIAGQNYLPVVQLQSVILALFPAVLYLIGKLIHSRTAGLLVGMLVIYQQANSIASTLVIQVSHSRLMMTEFPTAFGIALLSLVLLYWMKHPQVTSMMPMLSGGILGALILTRTNPLFLVPFVILLIIFSFGRHWKKWFGASMMLLAGVMLVIGPWFFANRTPEGRFFIEEKIGAVFTTRYDVAEPAPVSGSSTSGPQQSLTATPSAAVSPHPTTTPPAKEPQGVQNGGIFQAISSLGSRIQRAFQFAPAHFMHNLVMSVLILPLSHSINDSDYLDFTLKAPYWQNDWNGDLPSDKLIFLFVNLFILAIGIGAAWKYSKLAGLVPLTMLVGYYLSNALGRTSGSRYLVPADWVVLFYFGVGLIQLSIWGAVFLGFRQDRQKAVPIENQLPRKPRRWIARNIALALGLLLLGSSVIWIGKFYPVRYPMQTSEELKQAAFQRGSLQQNGITSEDFTNLLNSQGAVILRGRALYPRYYPIKQGEPASRNNLPFSGRDYARLIVRVIGPNSKVVVLPLVDQVNQFPDAADVTVIGCQEEQDVLAHVLILEGNPDKVFLRSPSAPWECLGEK
jgi:hypothetical protein